MLACNTFVFTGMYTSYRFVYAKRLWRLQAVSLLNPNAMTMFCYRPSRPATTHELSRGRLLVEPQSRILDDNGGT